MNTNEPNMIVIVLCSIAYLFLVLSAMASIARYDDEDFFFNKIAYFLVGWWFEPMLRGKKRKPKTSDREVIL